MSKTIGVIGLGSIGSRLAKRVGIPPGVAKEFNAADVKTGILRKKKPTK